MDDRLGMNDHIEPLGRHAEQEVRLDQFEPLVHQARPNRSSPSAPSPSSDGRAPRSRVAAAMRSALHSRNGPPEAVIVIIAMVSGSRDPIAWKSALCSESIGRSRAPARARRLHHHRAGAHQRLLVGERDRASGRDRREGRLEARGADDRRDDEVGLAQRGLARPPPGRPRPRRPTRQSAALRSA